MTKNKKQQQQQQKTTTTTTKTKQLTPWANIREKRGLFVLVSINLRVLDLLD